MSNFKTLSTFFNKNCSLTRLVNEITDATIFDYILDGFYDNFFNIDTATEYWVEIWGIIVNQGRAIKIPSVGDFFGFAGDDGAKTFNEAPFFDGEPSVTSFTITDLELYRHTIKTKQLINISDCSIPSLNAIVAYFFEDAGASFVTDGYNMSITYWLAVAANSDQALIFSDPAFCPRPAGVLVNLKFNEVYSNGYDFFGFAGSLFKTFNEAPFIDETL